MSRSLEEQDQALLLNELAAAEGSFIASVRFDLRWNSKKFRRLCRAMHNAAKANAGSGDLPRGMSQLFWYCGTFLPAWFDQREFRVGQPHVDYGQVATILRTLGNEWFGEDCLSDDTEFERQLAGI